ncbi:MAG: CRTAC1 family protein [Planctomycetota bacterium]
MPAPNFFYFVQVFFVLNYTVSFLLAQAQENPPLFENVTAIYALKEENASRVTFADLNVDGLPDILLDSSRLFLNQSKKIFIRASNDEVFQPSQGRPASLVQIGDINNDGLPDLFIGRYTDLSNVSFKDDGLRHEIWIGNPQGGHTLQKDSGLGTAPETTISACFVDFNRDGNLDLFLGNAYTAYGHSLEAFPDRLYQGLGDGRFQEITEKAGILGVPEAGLRESRKPTYGVTHTDWNNDGFQDLLVMSYGRQWNRLWKNNGDGTFIDVAEETHFDGDANTLGIYPPGIQREAELPFRSNGNTFDAAVADFDGDGDMDCFLAEITHWWAGNSSDRSMLLINQGAEHSFQFQRDLDRIVRTHSGPAWNQGDLHAGWIDVDNDGALDLLIASSDYPDDQILRLYHQNSDHTFEEWTSQLGFHWLNACQISLADIDRDGATDILLGTSHTRLTEKQRAEHPLTVGLFRNLCPARLGNGFINIRLKGQFIGARVTIWIGKRRQTREIQGGLGHAGHRDDTDCRFGIGKAEQIDRIEVRWPDTENTIQTFENVSRNCFYQLIRGGALEKNN